MADKLLTGRRLLVVEDEMLVLMIMEDTLADMGCTSVAVAATVAQALQLLATQDFDAAILDVNLNGDQSYPVADALVSRGVPFAFSTGSSDHAMRESYPASPILKKPYRYHQVEAMLTALLPPASGDLGGPSGALPFAA